MELIPANNSTSELKVMTKSGYHHHERFRVAFELAGIGIGLVDQHGRFFEVNRELCEMFGIGKDELVGMTMRGLPVPDGDTHAENPDNLVKGAVANITFEKRFLSARGNILWAEVTLRPACSPTETPEFFIAGFHDITDRKFLQNVLERQATVDPLTRALNRPTFAERAHSELMRSGRHRYRLSLVMADLDRFKAINDTYGHAAGDKVLSVFGDITRTCLREMDLFGRWGGEEFLILLPDSGPVGAMRVSERIRASLQGYRFSHGFQVTASLGVVSRRAGENFSSMVDRADAAMYQAKQNGRNQVYCNTKDLHRESTHKLDQLARLELHWRKAYASGNSEIDAEHQMKFQIANRILTSLSADPGGAGTPPLVDELLAHIAEHFPHEEKLLESLEYPEIEAHKESHRALLDHARELAAKFKQGQMTAGAFMGFIIHDLVATHIMQEDRKYFSWIKRSTSNGGQKRRLGSRKNAA
jgi:diguanylate cyclase (GGDEF)-like protein/hemerythrin-like metal-binding protein/PAS domain S-box-containing protein